MTNLDKQIAELIAENEALKAMLELIKIKHREATSDIVTLFKYQQSSFETGEYRVDGQSCNELGKLIQSTPEQCLESVRIDAIRDLASTECPVSGYIITSEESRQQMIRWADFAEKCNNEEE